MLINIVTYSQTFTYNGINYSKISSNTLKVDVNSTTVTRSAGGSCSRPTIPPESFTNFHLPISVGSCVLSILSVESFAFSSVVALVDLQLDKAINAVNMI